MALQGELALLFANSFQILNRRVQRSRHEGSQLREGAARLRRVTQSAPPPVGLLEKRFQFLLVEIV